MTNIKPLLRQPNLVKGPLAALTPPPMPALRGLLCVIPLNTPQTLLAKSRDNPWGWKEPEREDRTAVPEVIWNIFRDFLKTPEETDLASRAAAWGGKFEQKGRSACSLGTFTLAGPKHSSGCAVKAHLPSYPPTPSLEGTTARQLLRIPGRQTVCLMLVAKYFQFSPFWEHGRVPGSSEICDSSSWILPQ